MAPGTTGEKITLWPHTRSTKLSWTSCGKFLSPTILLARSALDLNRVSGLSTRFSSEISVSSSFSARAWDFHRGSNSLLIMDFRPYKFDVLPFLQLSHGRMG